MVQLQCPSLEDDIHYSSVAGFQRVEVWVNKLEKFLNKYSKEDLKKILDETSISAPCLCAFGGLIFSPRNLFEERVKGMEKYLEVGSFIGSKYIVLCAEGFGGKSFEKAKKIYISRLKELSRILESYDIKIALEWFEKLSPAIDIVNSVDDENIGFLIDMFH